MIQAAVLEVLTKEYEMSKVQEAKEIPTVKVLDAADIPTRDRFHRVCSSFFSERSLRSPSRCLGLRERGLARNRRHRFPQGVCARSFSTVSARMPFISQNGSGIMSVNGGRGLETPEQR